MKRILTSIKKIIFNKWLLLFVGCLFLFVFLSNLIIIKSTQDDIYETVASTPVKEVGLILGTSRYTSWGGTNLYFKYRINAAAALYKSGKIKHIIVSGDNSLKSYNEPREMLNALMAKGIPEDAITLDFAGFRTLDSVVRCKEVFGQSDIIIISQRFHVERALFIANKYSMKAIGFAAKDVPDQYSYKTKYREYLAKTKAVIDLYLINKKPKFLGKAEKINV